MTHKDIIDKALILADREEDTRYKTISGIEPDAIQLYNILLQSFYKTIDENKTSHDIQQFRVEVFQNPIIAPHGLKYYNFQDGLYYYKRGIDYSVKLLDEGTETTPNRKREYTFKDPAPSSITYWTCPVYEPVTDVNVAVVPDVYDNADYLASQLALSIAVQMDDKVKIRSLRLLNMNKHIYLPINSVL